MPPPPVPSEQVTVASDSLPDAEPDEVPENANEPGPSLRIESAENVLVFPSESVQEISAVCPLLMQFMIALVIASASSSWPWSNAHLIVSEFCEAEMSVLLSEFE